MSINKAGKKVKYVDISDTIEKLIKKSADWLDKEIRQIEKAIKQMDKVVFKSDL